MRVNIQDKFRTQIIPFAIGVALLLSISTNLRFENFSLGLGDLLLAVLAVVGLWSVHTHLLYFKPIVVFWVVVLIGMALGALNQGHLEPIGMRHSMAYLFTAGVSIGISGLLNA